MERIREDKKVIDEINRRKDLEKNWEMYEKGLRNSSVKSTNLSSREVHSILVGLLETYNGPKLIKRKNRDNL